MKTYFLMGDANYRRYGGKWVTKRLNNGDWDYWIVLELINMREAIGDDVEDTYVVEITAISPKAAGWKNIKSALGCCDLRFKDFKPEFLANGGKIKLVLEALSSYGISAPLDSFSGNNCREVLRRARKALPAIEGMFGFFMDGTKNRIGNNGWDFISGNIGMNTSENPVYIPNMHVEM